MDDRQRGRKMVSSSERKDGKQWRKEGWQAVVKEGWWAVAMDERTWVFEKEKWAVTTDERT